MLFDGASAVVNAGHRVGFVGRNGTGKTTLLRLITGALEPEKGTVSVSGRWPNRHDEPGGTLGLTSNPVETVLAADHELTALQREAATATDHARIVESSRTPAGQGGAQRACPGGPHSRRARLRSRGPAAPAQHVLGVVGACGSCWRPSCLPAPICCVLDEPTNHLDLEATLWLEEYLRRYSGTVLVVSHERDLLNSVAQKILHLEHAQLKLYQGGYDRFERTRRMQLARDAKLRTAPGGAACPHRKVRGAVPVQRPPRRDRRSRG